MPLPAGGGAWPPTNLAPAFDRLASYAAWWTGDPDDLVSVYGSGTGSAFDSTSRDRMANHPSQYRGGVVGRLARWFWGEPVNFNQRSAKLHVPIGGDIARTSAELLFAEPPKITVAAQKDVNGDEVTDAKTQDRLNELVDDGMHATFLEAAEVCAALGGVYLRICWDTTVAKRPWLSAVHADAAVPEWRWGCLAAVTYWEELSRDEKEVVRHLERHEPGYILHGLYKGTPTDLGKPIDLSSFPETAIFAPVIETGIPKLTSEYVPNMKPNRLWRSLPAAAPMGRSDYAGIEPMMDALDETWSSWMRDIRLGKSRLIVPESALENLGPGQGSRWDPAREIYEGLNLLQQPGQDQITEIQFDIRHAEHKASVDAELEAILRGAGYSAQTFGLAGEVAITATEVAAKERASITTRGRKIGYTRPPLASALETLLMVDARVFNSGVTPVKPDLDFGDYVAESMNDRAQTAQLMLAADAASTETRVQLLHPEWDDDQVAEEVARIQAEQPVAGGFGDPGQQDVPGLDAGMGLSGPGTPQDQQLADEIAALEG
jgi:hypothetical protein